MKGNADEVQEFDIMGTNAGAQKWYEGQKQGKKALKPKKKVNDGDDMEAIEELDKTAGLDNSSMPIKKPQKSMFYEGGSDEEDEAEVIDLPGKKR